MSKDQLFKESGLQFDNWLFRPEKFSGLFEKQAPRAHLSKDPKLFGSWFRRHETLQILLIFTPFTTYKNTSFTERGWESYEWLACLLKCFRHFRETCPRTTESTLGKMVFLRRVARTFCKNLKDLFLHSYLLYCLLQETRHFFQITIVPCWLAQVHPFSKITIQGQM